MPRVAVIGGGIIGAAAAYHLARQGYGVTLFERDQLGGGSTGRSVGEVEAQYAEEDAVSHRVFSLRFLERLEQETGRRLIHRNGYLRLGRTDDALRGFAESLRLQNELGWTGARLLDVAEAASIVPGLCTDGISGALLGPHDGYVDPVEVTDLLVAQARSLGATVRIGHEVRSVTPGPSGVELEVGAEVLHCEVAVVAAGPWLDSLRAGYGAEGRIRNERHEVCVVTLSQDYPDIPFTMDYLPGGDVPGIYFRLEGPGRMLIGLHDEGSTATTVSPDDWQTSLSDAGRDAIIARFLEIMPAVGATAGFLGGWAGLYPFTDTGIPTVTWAVPGRVLEAVGFGGVGVQLGPWAGHEVQRLVASAVPK